MSTITASQIFNQLQNYSDLERKQIFKSLSLEGRETLKKAFADTASGKGSSGLQGDLQEIQTVVIDKTYEKPKETTKGDKFVKGLQNIFRGRTGSATMELQFFKTMDIVNGVPVQKVDLLTRKVLNQFDKETDANKRAILKEKVHTIIDQAKFNLGGSSDEEAILKEIEEMIVGVGCPITIPEDAKSPEIQEFYRLLLRSPPTFAELLKNKDLVHSIFVEKDPKFFAMFRAEVQGLLEEIYRKNLENQSFSLSDEALLGHLLSLYPLLSPEEGEELKVPVFANGKLELASYTVGFIEMRASEVGTPHRAVTLAPKENNHPPIILMKATTFPSDDGFGATLLSDFNPFASVGKYTFDDAKEKIGAWLDAQKAATGQKALVFGVSLGGALALHAAAAFPEKLAHVSAYCTPALWASDFKNYDASEEKPTIKIFNQDGGDVVPLAGFAWPKGAELYKVFQEKSGFNPTLAHIHCHVADSGNIIVRVNPERDVSGVARVAFAIAHVVLSIFVIYPLVHFHMELHDLLLRVVTYFRNKRQQKTAAITV